MGRSVKVRQLQFFDWARNDAGPLGMEKMVMANGSSHVDALTTHAIVGHDLTEVWSMLVSDSGADAAVVSPDGKVLYMSPVLSWWAPTRPAEGFAGKHLAELFNKSIADERQQMIRKVVESGKPLVVHAAWKGIRTRTVMRPLRNGSNAIDRVLIICRGMVPADESRAAQADMEVVQAQHVDKGQLANLTPRELEILALIGQGLTTAAIAEKLYRSRKTIEAHRLSLGIKLNARNRVDLARIAVQSGLVPPDIAVIDRRAKNGPKPE
jgi:DNA-binding CsgD family transcriptional regulator